jgi:hypothetical protein
MERARQLFEHLLKLMKDQLHQVGQTMQTP